MSLSDGSETRLPISPSEFTAVLDRHQETLYRFLWGLVSDVEQARDLLQDTFHAAWQVARRTEPPFLAGGSQDQMRYWLFQVAYHRAISALRRRRLIRWESLEESHEREPEVFAAARMFENDIAEREAMRAALEHLAPQDVACLFLRLVQGFTPAEIGEIVGVSPSQISKRLARAKQRLRHAYLAQEDQQQPVSSKKETRI